MESFFDKFVNYVIVDLLEMECKLTILLQVFLKATNIDFFEIYKLSVGFCLLKLHPELEELYEHCKAKPSSYAATNILLIVLSKMSFLNQSSSLKRILNESNFDRSAAFQELPF